MLTYSKIEGSTDVFLLVIFFPDKASDCGNLDWLGMTKRQFYRDWYTLLNSLPPVPLISEVKITGLVIRLVTYQS